MKSKAIIIKYFSQRTAFYALNITWFFFALLAFPGFAQNSESQKIEKQEEISHLGSQELLLKGVSETNAGRYNSARMYFEEARIRAIEIDSSRLHILALNNIGNLFYYLNNLDSAMSYYYLAVELAEKSEFLDLQNTLNNNIGIIYSSLGNNREAKQFMEKALAISILLNDTLKIAINLANLGGENVGLKEYWEAKSNLLKAEKLYTLLDDSSGLRSINMSLGNLDYVDSNYEDALSRFQRSLEYSKGTQHLFQISTIYAGLGKAEFALKNYEKALEYLDTSYSAAIESNQLNEATVSLYWKTKVYQEIKDYENALECAWKSMDIKDSIIRLEKKNWIEQSKVKYQFDLKEREFEILKESSSKQLVFVRLLATGLVIIIVLLIIILRMRMKASKRKEEKFLAEKLANKAKLSQAKTRNIELEEKLENINFELVSKTLLIDNKNQILDSIGSLVSEAELNNEGNNKHLRQLKQHLLRDNNVEQNWEDFKLYFERVHTDFFQKIHKKYPNLTSTDLRLMAFVLLQFNAKEISQILNISPDSVRKRKQRLREKLQLDAGDDLLNYLYTYTS